MTKKAVVYKENTLGLLGSAFGKASVEVLNGLVSQGGKTFMDSLILFVKEEDFRPATLADFDRFRVCHHPDYLV